MNSYAMLSYRTAHLRTAMVEWPAYFPGTSFYGTVDFLCSYSLALATSPAWRRCDAIIGIPLFDLYSKMFVSH